MPPMDMHPDDMTEPILQENKQRFVLFPIKHPQVWEMYKNLPLMKPNTARRERCIRGSIQAKNHDTHVSAPTVEL